MTSTIKWLSLEEGDPAGEHTALIALPGGVDAGFFERGTWRFLNGALVQEKIIAWAPMPDAPTP